MTPEKEQTVLQALSALADNPSLSQRALAKHMDIALGAANAHIQYCIRSGFLRKSLIGRTGYQITEKGWKVKREITAHTYARKMSFNNKLSEEYRTLIARLSQRGFRSFLIQGTNEMSNMAYVAARTMGVEVAAFVKQDNLAKEYLGIPVVEDAQNMLPQQAILFTDIEDAQNSFNALSAKAGRRRVAVPELLQELITTKDLSL